MYNLKAVHENLKIDIFVSVRSFEFLIINENCHDIHAVIQLGWI